MTDSKTTSATLRGIRANLNLTQEQLAERLGVSFATVNRWEGGANIPQKAARLTITALAAEAGIDFDEPNIGSTEAASQVTRRRTGRARSSAPSTKPMEQMLWDAACSIRGEKDAAKFKDYLLPLLFLKRLSDVFDDEIHRLAEEYGDRETAAGDRRRRPPPSALLFAARGALGCHQWSRAIRVAERRSGPKHAPEGHRRASHQGGPRSRQAESVAFGRHRRRRLRRRAQRRARHQSGQAARGRRDVLRSALSARPGRRAAGFPRPRLRISAAEIRRRARARALASSSRRPKSAS